MSVARDPRRRREIARRAGRVSGARRRALARGRRTPHCRDQHEGLALAYRVRQVPRDELRRLFQERICDVDGIRFSERGFQTLYAEYRAEFTRYRASGQDFQTTNAQRALALAARGRPRCARTVRRTRQRIERMGLIAYHHVRRLGARAGYRDTLRVRLLNPSFVPLPSAARAGKAQAPSLPALASTTTALIAPPDGGRARPPDKPAGNGSTERGSGAAARERRMANRRMSDLLGRLDQLTLALGGTDAG